MFHFFFFFRYDQLCFYHLRDCLCHLRQHHNLHSKGGQINKIKMQKNIPLKDELEKNMYKKFLNKKDMCVYFKKFSDGPVIDPSTGGLLMQECLVINISKVLKYVIRKRCHTNPLS